MSYTQPAILNIEIKINTQDDIAQAIPFVI
jgi:hypothetical protein